MALKSAVSYTQHTQSFEAGIKVSTDLLLKMEDIAPDFIFLFITVGHDLKEVIKGIRAVMHKVPICGCSSAGNISQYAAYDTSHSIVLMGMKSDTIKFEPFIFDAPEAHHVETSKKIADKIKSCHLSSTEKQLLILLSDGFMGGIDKLVKQIDVDLGYHIDIVGGSAGNDYQSETSYQFYNEEIGVNSVAGVLLHGDFNYEVMVTHGSKPMGLFRTVTKAQGYFIYEIDHKPALDLVASIADKNRMDDLKHTFNLLEIGEKFEGQGYSADILNRAIIGYDLENGSIRLPIEMKENSKIRITRRDKNLVLQNTKAMGLALAKKMANPQQASYLFFECTGRGSHLFGEPHHDVDALLEAIGKDKNVSGFFTFGELGPIQNNNIYHNYSAVLVGIE